ncbi:HNH endonuclease [Myroides fluvii]|uniref:HNH endonuclease n=1 Tax=Myroides fluvii TaxID=2572594 RepID=UPI00131AE226|nr:HNH endonuclease [Myroides fluvii]
MKRIFIFLVLLVGACTVYSCKKGGKVVEKVSSSKGGKKVIENLSGQSTDLTKKYSFSKPAKQALTYLSPGQLTELTTDLDRLKGKAFEKYIVTSPEGIKAYNALYASQNLRVRVPSLKAYEKQIAKNPKQIPTLRVGDLEHRTRDVFDKRLAEVNEKFKSWEVPFSKRIIDLEKFKVEGLFPNFFNHTLAKIDLPSKYYQQSNKNQFAYATYQLKEQYKRDPKVIETKLIQLNKGKSYSYTADGVTKELKDKELLAKQIEDLKSPHGDKIFGFTWHHHEDVGKLELVSQQVHNAVSHTGGNLIWGGLR